MKTHNFVDVVILFKEILSSLRDIQILLWDRCCLGSLKLGTFHDKSLSNCLLKRGLLITEAHVMRVLPPLVIANADCDANKEPALLPM